MMSKQVAIISIVLAFAQLSLAASSRFFLVDNGEETQAKLWGVWRCWGMQYTGLEGIWSGLGSVVGLLVMLWISACVSLMWSWV